MNNFEIMVQAEQDIDDAYVEAQENKYTKQGHRIIKIATSGGTNNG